MLSRQEFAAAMAGVRGLVRLDPKAFAFFNATHEGFWRSFWAAAILAPFTAIAVAREAAVMPPDSLWRFIAFQTIGYALGWLAFPLAMVRIADLLGRRDRYFHYMVALNWFHLVEIVFWGPLLVLGMTGILPGTVEQLLGLVVLVALLGYEWFIARHGLKIEGGTAAALVAIDFLLSLVIDRLADSLP
jgi:hypothetical protein